MTVGIVVKIWDRASADYDMAVSYKTIQVESPELEILLKNVSNEHWMTAVVGADFAEKPKL